MQMAEKLKKIEGRKNPSGFDYSSVNDAFRSLKQAARDKT
jgi:hypothetical protein